MMGSGKCFLLFLGITVLLLRESQCHIFEFHDDHDNQTESHLCLVEYVDTWQLDGTVTLTDDTFIVLYKPVVIITTLKYEICRIDLTHCAPNSSSAKNLCYCREKVGDMYFLSVRQLARMKDSKMAVYAAIPLKDAWHSNIMRKSYIRVIPQIHTNEKDIHAFWFYTATGPPEPEHMHMMAVQDVQFCPHRYGSITVCIHGRGPHSYLRATSDGAEWRTRSRCLEISKVFLESSRDITVTYDKRKTDCQDHAVGYTFNVEVAKGHCGEGQVQVMDGHDEPCPQALQTDCYHHEHSLPRQLAIYKKRKAVLCDTESDGGGYIVIQTRKSDKAPNFNATYAEYESGFGALTGNFWWGLKNTYDLCNKKSKCSLIINMDKDGFSYFARYKKFYLGPPQEGYKLYLSGFSSENLGVDALAENVGQGFSTKDRDNDAWKSGSCAARLGGAWWYSSCGITNLNGVWKASPELRKGVFWREVTTKNGNLDFVEMKVRPRN